MCSGPMRVVHRQMAVGPQTISNPSPCRSRPRRDSEDGSPPAGSIWRALKHRRLSDEVVPPRSEAKVICLAVKSQPSGGQQVPRQTHQFGSCRAHCKLRCNGTDFRVFEWNLSSCLCFGFGAAIAPRRSSQSRAAAFQPVKLPLLHLTSDCRTWNISLSKGRRTTDNG